MVKIRELDLEERLAITYLREAGLSYSEIGRQLGCSKSTAHKIFTNFEKTGAIAKQSRPGRPRKLTERVKKVVCSSGHKLGLVISYSW